MRKLNQDDSFITIEDSNDDESMVNVMSIYERDKLNMIGSSPSRLPELLNPQNQNSNKKLNHMRSSVPEINVGTKKMSLASAYLTQHLKSCSELEYDPEQPRDEMVPQVASPNMRYQ